MTKKHTQFLVIRISRPFIRRPLVHHLGNIHKPRINHLLLIKFRTLRRATEFVRRFDHEAGPLLDVRILLESVVVALCGECYVLTFNPAAGTQRVEGLRKEFGKVADRAGHHAGEDEVEVVGEGPFVFEVVDLELEICGEAVIISQNELDCEDCRRTNLVGWG